MLAEDKGYSEKSMRVSKDTKDKLDELIKVKTGTHEALTRRGRKKDSYDDIIQDLIKLSLEEIVKLKKEVKRLEDENREYKEALGINKKG